MDTYDETAKKVETTYKNIIEELGPCIKHLVVAGRTYLKSIHGMNVAHKNYNDALSKIANLAENSTVHGSSDIGTAIHHIVRINKEMLAQQSNILKSLEFDFLEPMEIAAEKDTKLVGREQKRFQRLQKSRKEDFEKSMSTLKKTRRKKGTSSEKQLSQMKMMENSKSRLEEFCDESLKEAIIQERILCGTVLENLCKYNKQLLTYHNKGAELLQTNILNWESLADTKDILPNNCFSLQQPPQDKDSVYSIYSPSITNGNYPKSLAEDSDTYGSTRTITTQKSARSNNAFVLTSSGSETPTLNSISGRMPLVRAKSEYNVSTNTYLPARHDARFSQIIQYDEEIRENKCVRAIYPYGATDESQMSLKEGDVIKFVDGEESEIGWQFGDNITSNESGWFPISYTEPIKKETDILHAYSNKPTKHGRRPLPPPPLSTVETSDLKFASSQAQLSETSDYGSMKKLPPKRLLPVNPPTVLSAVQQTEGIYQNASALRSSLYAETKLHNYNDVSMMGKPVYYPNIPLQSMHL